MPRSANLSVATMGIDIGKNSFHVVGLDQRGAIVVRQRWTRSQIRARLANWMSPWRKARPHWRYTVELLLKAAKTRKISDIAAATSQMERALRRGG